jgi:monovalent cation:H+ antiporter-2, CPA2 family
MTQQSIRLLLYRFYWGCSLDMDQLGQVLILLGFAVAVVVAFQRFHVPTSLGYLLVGIILGPHTLGPTVHIPEFKALAEFGVVFLLFTIGLNYSLPQLQTLKHQVLGLGTAQVVITTAVVGVLAWLVGLGVAAAFVIGAVFAQSSSTLIASQLAEQSEENMPHGRLGLAMSVFQDVTAVPFLVVIPVLGAAVGAELLASALGWAVAKAAFVMVLLFLAGRWLLRPLFHLVAKRRSAEVFTLAVLLVALMAAWATNSMGLSLAFGGFLAGMMLGETEFRHQVESSIRPFRDVLLGLFFIGIGMLFDVGYLADIWLWAVVGAVVILASKTLIVAALVRRSGLSASIAWRTGLLLSVGGEFGFALLAIALDTRVIDLQLGQIALASVLIAMVAGALLIRFNSSLAALVAGSQHIEAAMVPGDLPDDEAPQVVIGGYGRVGHILAVLMKEQGIRFLALDKDPARVLKGRDESHNVVYGDVSDFGLLMALKVERASLVVITIDGPPAALQAVRYLRDHCPHVPVIARARDLKSSSKLVSAGAILALPEAIEASLLLGERTLQTLGIAQADIDVTLQTVRDWGYRPVLEEDRKA